MNTSILKEFLANQQLASIIEPFLSKNDIEELIKLRNSYVERALYKSEIHGVNHSEKVMLFACILCNLENINGVAREIALDAAIYHDIGRQNDMEDNFHGYSSGHLIGKFLKKEIYKNDEYFSVLKASMDFHSASTRDIDSLALDYEIENITLFKQVAYILKDADALDRTRFKSTINAYLDESYLNIESSKEIIEFAKTVNAFYSSYLSEEKDNRHLLDEIGPGIHLHGVGNDIFKMNSIIKNGILSKEEMKRNNIKGTANFNGGNGEDWISLVDTSKINDDSLAFKDFVLNGISFSCNVDKTYLPFPLEEKAKALNLRVPYDNSKNKEEVYAYKKIDFENILSINVPNSLKTIPISECNFLFMSLSYDLFYDRIKHYSDEIKIDFKLFEKMFEDRKKLAKALDSLEMNKNCNNCQGANFKVEKEEIIKKLKEQNIEANQIIADHINLMYQQKLNRKNISIYDVAVYELSQHNLPFVVENTDLFTILKRELEFDKVRQILK